MLSSLMFLSLIETLTYLLIVLMVYIDCKCVKKYVNMLSDDTTGS